MPAASRIRSAHDRSQHAETEVIRETTLDQGSDHEPSVDAIVERMPAWSRAMPFWATMVPSAATNSVYGNPLIPSAPVSSALMSDNSSYLTPLSAANAS